MISLLFDPDGDGTFSTAHVIAVKGLDAGFQYSPDGRWLVSGAWDKIVRTTRPFAIVTALGREQGGSLRTRLD